MMQRTGIAVFLASLLALTPAAVVQAQPPSPAATPVYAPEDLTSTLPSHLGDRELQIDRVEFDFLPHRLRGFWQELLETVGEEPEALRNVVGIGHRPFDDADVPAFDIWVNRIVGLPAASWVDDLMAQHFEWIGPEAQARFDVSWQEIAGRQVYRNVPTPEGLETMASEWGLESSEINTQGGFYLYPKGEVLFSVMIPLHPLPDDAPTIAEVLAALP